MQIKIPVRSKESLLPSFRGHGFFKSKSMKDLDLKRLANKDLNCFYYENFKHP